MFQSVDEADHVVTHRRAVDAINKATCLKSGVLSLGRERENKSAVFHKTVSIRLITNIILGVADLRSITDNTIGGTFM